MPPKDPVVMAQWRALRDEVKHHQSLYYEHDAPVLADQDYDRLFASLEALEACYPWLRQLEDDPLIGPKPAEGFVTRIHEVPMLSLANGWSEEDVRAFFHRLGLVEDEERHAVAIEPKIDGISFAAVYEEGRLVHVATRGDGTSGEDITANILTIQDFPRRLKGQGVPERFELRGEVFMRRSDFDALNQRRREEGLPLFKNPRNAAGGSLRQLDARVTATRPLCYQIYHAPYAPPFLKDQRSLLDWLDAMDVAVVEPRAIVRTVEQAADYYHALLTARPSTDYDMDGVVLKLNDFRMREHLGAIARSPRWAMAWKFPSMQATTRLEAITVQVGRTGVLTPVAHLAPVSLAGVTVTRASLHNEEEIRRKDIRVGDTVWLERAGDVIPYIQSVVLEHRPLGSEAFLFPTVCPSCGTEVLRVQGEVAVRCPNRHGCPAQQQEWLLHIVSRAALDIEGLGESQLQTLADEGWVKHPGDLLRLPEHPDLSALARHHGWGMQSLRNMVGAIRTARETTLARGIYALAMRHIGQQTAELLAEYYVQPEGFWGAMLRVAAGDEEARTELLRLHGVGPAVLQSVERSFGDASWRQTAEDFWHGLRWKAGVAEAAIAWPLLLEGERVVFTGTLEGMTRDEAFAWVRRLGGEVLGQLSPRATLLVAGQGGGSKKVKAEQWSIPIWDGSTWAALIADAQTQATALHARGVE